jgi:hypothetical protein
MLADSRNAKDMKHYAWAVIAAQKSFQLQISEMKEVNLRDWVEQYAEYLGDGGHGRKPFAYKKSEMWDEEDDQIGYHDLTRWILTSADDENTVECVQKWNRMISTYCSYHATVDRDVWNKQFLPAQTALKMAD